MNFDQIHPAVSVVNHIFDIRDRIKARSSALKEAAPAAMPAVPAASIEGAELEQQLAQPAQGATGPMADGMLGSAVADVGL